jgi:hypothetical protein
LGPGEFFDQVPHQGRTGKGKSKETPQCVVIKMAAGRMVHQHNKSLPIYIWYYRERQKTQATKTGPETLTDRRDSVLFTSFFPLVGCGTTLRNVGKYLTAGIL